MNLRYLFGCVGKIKLLSAISGVSEAGANSSDKPFAPEGLKQAQKNPPYGRKPYGGFCCFMDTRL